ncbi:hypothetical protein [Streptacidiphilus sp. MAP5-52]|uniref:hypothetical protein n=1 Tax=Streptacidiphilus sp. MAP5-52 TaxID=3156267 RepID=UPI003513D61B
MTSWWARRREERRAQRAAADSTTRRAGQVQAAVDLAITECARPQPVTSLADIDYRPKVDPFDVVRLADELFGLELEYDEAREQLIDRMRFRGYLGWPYARPAWLAEDNPLAGDDAGEGAR